MFSQLSMSCKPLPPSPSPSAHPLKSLAEKAPSSLAHVGPLREGLDTSECITDVDRSVLASKYWSGIWAPRSESASHSARVSFLSHYKKSVNPNLIQDVSLETVHSAIVNSSNTSAGPDGIAFSAWRAAPDLAESRNKWCSW